MTPVAVCREPAADPPSAVATELGSQQLSCVLDTRLAHLLQHHLLLVQDRV